VVVWIARAGFLRTVVATDAQRACVCNFCFAVCGEEVNSNLGRSARQLPLHFPLRPARKRGPKPHHLTWIIRKTSIHTSGATLIIAAPSIVSGSNGSRSLLPHVSTTIMLALKKAAGAKKRGLASLQPSPIVTKQARRSYGGSGLLPPLRGAATSRTQALATFHGLVEAGGNGGKDVGPEAAAGNDPGALRPTTTAHAAAAPAAAPPTTIAAPAGLTDPPPADPLPTTKAATVSAGEAAKQLPQLVETLQRCLEKMGQRRGSYLYQHHEEIACARKQLDACMAALQPALAAAGGSDDKVVRSLQEGSTLCWVRLLCFWSGACMHA